MGNYHMVPVPRNELGGLSLQQLKLNQYREILFKPPGRSFTLHLCGSRQGWDFAKVSSKLSLFLPTPTATCNFICWEIDVTG